MSFERLGAEDYALGDPSLRRVKYPVQLPPVQASWVQDLVSICIVTANRREAAAKALRSAGSQSYEFCEILVLDNGSGDDTAARLSESEPVARIYRADYDVGCPGGRNILMAKARGEFTLHLDDDAELSVNAARDLVRVARMYPSAGIVMMRIEEYGRCRVKAPTGTILPFFSGGASLIRAEAIRRCGMYDPAFVRQGEEEDLLIRLAEHGYDVRYCSEAVLHHRPEHRVGRAARETARLIAHHRVVNETATAIRYLPLSRAVRLCLRKWSGFVVRAIQARRPLAIAAAARAVLHRLPSHLRNRSPLRVGTRWLEAARQQYREAKYPVNVPCLEPDEVASRQVRAEQ